MATQKTKVKTVKAECCPMSVGDSIPCLYLDLQDQDVKQLGDLNVGDEVEILVKGTIKGLSQRERQDYDNVKKTVKTGSIDLEKYTVQVVEDEKDNLFTEMAKDEE